MSFGASQTVLGTGAHSAPVMITPADVVTNGSASEGRLVRVNGLTLVDALDWPAAGSSAFVRVTDGTDEFLMLVDEETDLDESAPPSAAFDLVGFLAQDDPQPFDDNHFVYPRGTGDLVVGDGSGTVAVTPSAIPEGSNGVSLLFAVTGQQATLETVEIDISPNWGWTGSLGDVVLSGAGFIGASASVVPGTPPTVRVTGGFVSASTIGQVAILNLDAPASPELSAFAVRTATPGGTPAQIATLPTVNVVTAVNPGDVVVNEVYAVTSAGSGSREGAEFVEIHNRTAMPLDISGWGLQDIGRTQSCALDTRWEFPAGTMIAAGGYVVVCRTAIDTGNPANPNDDLGFLVEFPSLPGGVPLFEMYDPEPNVSFGDFPSVPGGRVTDDPAVPNMVLVNGTADVDDQIGLLGGSITNGGQCESPNVPGRFVPYAELVVLTDVVGNAVDAFEYREIGPCSGDLCTGPFTGADDAYPFGAPKPGHSLGRDAMSTDTDASVNDVLPASVVTPGAANVPGDTVGPGLVAGAATGISANVIEIRYDESVDPATAEDPGPGRHHRRHRLGHLRGPARRRPGQHGDRRLRLRHDRGLPDRER